MTPRSAAARDGSTEVLRRARVALEGREVGMYESDERGHLHLLAASSEGGLPVSDDLEKELRARRIENPAGRRWVASKLSSDNWCIAPIRETPPGPPPSGIERRGRERVTLEIAGVCLGLLDKPAAKKAPARSANEILRQHQARLSLILEQVPALLWTTDEDLRITSRSGAGSDYEIIPERAVGVSLLEQYQNQRVTTESIEAHSRALGGEAVSYQFSSEGRHYDAHVKPLRADDGIITGVVGIAMDVTDREQALLDAGRDRRELEDFFENATVGMIFVAADGTVLRANQTELDLIGRGADEYVGQSMTKFHADPEVVEDALRRLQAGETIYNLETRLKHRDGSMREVLMSANALFEHARFVHARFVTRDVTERKQAEELLRHGAMHDVLTNLPNRAFFLERVHQAVERGQRDAGYHFAVLFLDFDNFKLVNDSLGHSAGDQLLTGISERLRKCVRPGDMVARLGGDEFTILLDDVAGQADVEQSARRILRCLNEPYRIAERDIHSSASIGVAMSGAGARPEDLVRDADIAMYRAKALARNLGIGVIAEGVENVTQRARLLEFGCQLGQGFHFAEPLEPAAASAMLETSGISPMLDSTGFVHSATPLAVGSRDGA